MALSLVDPTRDHVFPSGAAERAQAESREMRPPPSRAPKRRVLEEDEFVGAMEEIIERDFFPDLPRLERQMRWLEAVDSRDTATMRRVKAQIESEQRKWGLTPTPQPPSAPATPLAQTPTPTRANPPPPGPPPSVPSSGSEYANMSLDEFTRLHTSEDDVSFDELQAKDLAEHRRKWWWVYDADPEHRLRLLGNGQLMSHERRRLMDAACADKAKQGDHRPTNLDSHPYRAINTLMFQPGQSELEHTSRAICKVGQNLDALPARVAADGQPERKALPASSDDASTAPPALVTAAPADALALVPSEGRPDKDQPPSNTELIAQSLARRRRECEAVEARLAPKVIQHKNTRVRPLPSSPQSGAASASMLKVGPLGAGGGDSTPAPLTGTETPTTATLHQLVQMTPSPMPGAMGEESPLMTWGEVAGTPLILDPRDTPLASDLQPNPFAMKQMPAREQLGHKLDDKAQRKRKQMSATAKPLPGESATAAKLRRRGEIPTPLSTRGGSTSHRHRRPTSAGGASATPSTTAIATNRRLKTPLTPAAQELALRLASRSAAGSGFGTTGSVQLRNSYRGAGNAPSRRRQPSTPLAGSTTPLASAAASASSRAAPKRKRDVTDGLLRIG